MTTAMCFVVVAVAVAVVGDLEVSPTQHPYPVYSIDSSVHAEIQCQLTVDEIRKLKLIL
jgi:hypothetical protein